MNRIIPVKEYLRPVAIALLAVTPSLAPIARAAEQPPDSRPWWVPREFGASYAEGSENSSNIKAYRAHVRFPFLRDFRFFEHFQLRSRWELSAGHLDTNVPDQINYSGGEEESWFAAFTPVWRFTAPGYLDWASEPYFEVAVAGVGYFENDMLAAYSYEEGDLGDNWIFEDRLTIGITFHQWRGVSLRYTYLHFSNGWIKEKNDGLNLNMLTLSIPF